MAYKSDVLGVELKLRKIINISSNPEHSTATKEPISFLESYKNKRS
jgi:hypothetical protein